LNPFAVAGESDLGEKEADRILSLLRSLRLVRINFVMRAKLRLRSLHEQHRSCYIEGCFRTLLVVDVLHGS
ncbi:MAG: hypothetical protein AAF541_19935, partial [Pseudomonadota bacterium]